MAKRAAEAVEETKNSRLKLDDSQCVSIRAIVSNQVAAQVSDAAATYTDAEVQVSAYVIGAIERIVSVYGTIEAVAKALVSILSQNAQGSVRLTVPHYCLGTILGRHNARRNEIIDQTGVKLSTTETNLPLSSEKGLTLRGKANSIEAALQMIGHDYLRNKDRIQLAMNVEYRPPPIQGVYGHPASLREVKPDDTMVTAANPYGIAPNALQQPVADAQAALPIGPAAQQQQQQAQHPQQQQPAKSTERISQSIYIPNDMVGAIIGKQGSKINEIRNLSGSHIKIAEPDPARPTERLIQVEGTAEQNQAALYMLYQRLEAEKRRQ